MEKEASSISGNIFRNSLYIFLGMLISNISLFIINIIMARNLSKSDYGLFMTVQYIVGIIILIMNLGVPESTTKFIAEQIGKNRPQGLKNTIAASLKLMFFICTLFTVIQFIFAHPISQVFTKIEITFFIRLTAFWCFPIFLSILATSIIEGFQQMRYSYIVRNICEPFKLIILLILLALPSFTIPNIFIAWTLVYWVCALGIFLFLRSFLKRKNISIVLKDNGSTGKLLYSGLPFYLPFIAPLLVNSLLPVMVGKLSSVEEVADLAVVLQLASISALLLMPLSRALLPAVSTHFNGNKKMMADNLKTCFKWSGIINIILLIVMFLGGKVLLQFFFGQKYTGATLFLNILMISVFFENYKFSLDPLLKGTRFVMTVSRLEMARLGCLFLMSCWAIPRYGVLGAVSVLCIINVPVLIFKIWFIATRIQLGVWKIFIKELVIVLFIIGCNLYFK